MKISGFMARQGDVLICACDPAEADGLAEVPRDANGRTILAHGEATGHAHAILSNRAVLLAPDGRMSGRMILMLADGEPAELVHEEHGAIAIPAGSYRVTRQREYSPEALRYVAD